MTTGSRKDPAPPVASAPAPARRGEDTVASLRAELDARDQFLDLAGHQLRTPLTPATMLVHLMQADPGLPEHLHEHVRMLRENIEREAELIDELVDLGRLSRGKLSIVSESGVALDTLLENTVAAVKSDADAKRLRLTTSLTATRTRLAGDATRLGRLLRTVLNNAIVHSVAGAIDITMVDGHDGTAVIAVADQGSGISETDMSELFSPFPPRTGPSRKATSIGAGLAIGAAVARLHGGSLTANSAGVGRGAIFTLTLPARPAVVLPG